LITLMIDVRPLRADTIEKDHLRPEPFGPGSMLAEHTRSGTRSRPRWSSG